MYAVIKTGGKQYKVTPGDVIEVERLGPKSSNTPTPILVVDDQGKTIIGAKDLAAYKVGLKVVGEAKGDKVTVFKYRSKTGYASRTGHRQRYSLVEITSIGDAKAAGDGASRRGRGKAKASEQPDTLGSDGT